MNHHIHLQMRVSDIVATCPGSVSLFAAHGLEGLVSEEGLRALAPFLTLKTALRERGIAADAFLAQLAAQPSGRAAGETPAADDIRQCHGLSFLSLMPCGLKVPFARVAEDFFARRRSAGRPPLTYSLEGNVNHEVSYYRYVDQVETFEELPDMIVSSDFNAFFHQRFRERFLEPGFFTHAVDNRVHEAFVGQDIVDPAGQYRMLTINPLIIVADLEQVGDRPLPRRWQDLLDPAWRRDIALRGDGRFFCHAVLLPLYKEHGMPAMLALAANVHSGLHPAQMVKQIASRQPDRAALYVMPEFFARRILQTDRVRILWPEDGALVSPVTMLVKKDRASQLKEIADFMTGPELAAMFAGAGFPALHPAAPNRLPPGAPLKWLGWDFLRQHDLGQLNADIDAEFLPAVNGGEQ